MKLGAAKVLKKNKLPQKVHGQANAFYGFWVRNEWEYKKWNGE
jgi:hypothetical protein